MIERLKHLLAEPSTRGMDLDDPRTTDLRRRIVREKPFLRKIYEEWYRFIRDNLPSGDGPVLELGSGAGFLRDDIPRLVTSEIFACPGADVVLDGQRLPFPDACLCAIAMTNVLHHLPHARQFFTEAARCVRKDGAILMIEPWVTPWSRLVYTKLHHEPFDPRAQAWEFDSDGPLSGANGALPWILFHRDREKFEREFPLWRVEVVRPFMPLRYLISGGVSLRSLMPGWTHAMWRGIEKILCEKRSAMFAQIVLRRV